MVIDLWKIAPGDVIHRCNVNGAARGALLMIIACQHKPSRPDAVGINLHVLALYMLPTGGPCLREINIDSIEAHDYEFVIRQSTGRSTAKWI